MSLYPKWAFSVQWPQPLWFVTQTMAVADGEPRLHFLLTLPVARKKGAIWKEKVRSLKVYMVINRQGLMGRGCVGERREGGAGAVRSPVWLSGGCVPRISCPAGEGLFGCEFPEGRDRISSCVLFIYHWALTERRQGSPFPTVAWASCVTCPVAWSLHFSFPNIEGMEDLRGRMQGWSILVHIVLKLSYVWWVSHTLAFPLPLSVARLGFVGQFPGSGELRASSGPIRKHSQC